MGKGWLLALIWVLSGAALAQQRDPTARLLDAAAALDPFENDGVRDAKPEMAPPLTAEWQAMAAWAADYIERHPGSTHGAVARSLPATGDSPAEDISIGFDFLRLSKGAILVAAEDRWGGTVFILAPRRGRLTQVWSISEAGQTPAPTMPMLTDWVAERDQRPCNRLRPHKGSCGLLTARIGLLPPSADGSARFYTEASYAQDFGATFGGQFAVWRWNGASARPFVAHLYAVTADQPFVVKTNGTIITLRVKDFWEHFGSCGGCLGRQRDWRFRLTPAGIEDQGKHSLVPELDLVDRLFDRAFAGKPASDLASPHVAAEARRQALQIRRENKDNPDPTYIGMVTTVRRSRVGARTELCIDMDSLADRFTLSRGRIIRMRHVDPGGCGKANLDI